MSEHGLNGFISTLRSRLRRVLVIEGAARAIVFAVATIIIAILVDYFWPMPGVFRLFGLLAIAVGLVLLVHRRMHRPLRRNMDDHTLANLAERRIPDLNGRLLSSVDGIALNADDLDALDRLLTTDAAARLVPARTLPRYLAASSGMLIASAIIAILAPQFARDGFNRLFLPLGDAQWQRTSTISGALAHPVVPADEPLVVELQRDRGAAASMRLTWRNTADGDAVEESRILDGMDGPWRQALSLAPGRYDIVAASGDAKDLHLHGRVVARPQLASITATLTPPKYTGEAPKTLNTLSCSVLPGSKLAFTVDFSMEKDRSIAALDVLLGKTVIDVERTPLGLSGELLVKEGGELVISLLDQDQIGPKPEPRFALTLIEDRAPLVLLDGPRNNEAVTTRASLLLTEDARDDYGLATMSIAAQIVPALKPDAGNPEQPETEKPGAEKVLTQFLDVSGFAAIRKYQLGIGSIASVGEKVLLTGRAADANDVSGPGVGASQVLVLRVVSDADLRQELDRLLADARDRITQAREELGPGLAKKNLLMNASRNALMAARKAADTLGHVARRWQDNQLPAEPLAPIQKAQALVADQASPALGQVSSTNAEPEKPARVADAALSEAERLLNSILQEGDLSRQLSNLLDRQRALAEESKAFVREHLTKPLDDAAKATQANLAERQKDLAEQLKDIERKVLAGQASQLQPAQDFVRKEQPSDRLFQAGAKLASGAERTQAGPHQQAALAAMEKLLALLRGNDAAKNLANRAGELAAAQEKLVKELELGENPKELAQQQQELRDQVKELLKQVLEQAKESGAAKNLDAAVNSQEQAQSQMQKGDAKQSEREGGAAASQLREAQRQLQGDDDQQSDDKKDENKKKTPDVMALLRELRTLQTKVVTDSTVIHQRIGEKQLDFAAKRDVGAVAELQGDIVLRLDEEGIKELDQNPIALAALKRVEAAMKRAQERLDVPALGEKGLKLEKAALFELTRLIDIAENLPKPEQSQQSNQGQGQAPQSPFPPAAELALLAAMQDEIAARTAAGHPGDVAGDQEKVLALVTLLEQGARPGSRPAVLLSRAGRAMSSSHYLLEHKDHGLMTRHEQEAAAETLRRMLAEMKSMSSGGGEPKPQPQQQRQQNQGEQPQPKDSQPEQSEQSDNSAPQNSGPKQGQQNPDAKVGVDQKNGNLMILPPERREQLRQARDQNLPPAALKLYEHYLEVLEDQR